MKKYPVKIGGVVVEKFRNVRFDDMRAICPVCP
jgi:hypothetical protein